MLSPEEIAEIEHELPLFPRRSAAAIEGLRIVQRHRGWVSDDAIQDLAAFLKMSASELDGAGRRPVGVAADEGRVGRAERHEATVAGEPISSNSASVADGSPGPSGSAPPNSTKRLTSSGSGATLRSSRLSR